MIAGGHGDPNPNTSWLDSRGMWLAYILGVLAFHVILLAIPFVSIPMAWTITNLLHNLVRLNYERILYIFSIIGIIGYAGSSVLPTLHQRGSLDEHRYRQLQSIDPLGAD